MQANLPPIHDLVRFWHPNDVKTFQACKVFLSRQPPSWNLHWLRDWAPRIFSGELSASMLRQAVKANVPEGSRLSVNKAIDLILRSKDRHKWQGTQLLRKIVPCGIGETSLQPIGMYHSAKLKSEFVLALQPRAENIPNLEQFRLWHSSLYYNYAVERTVDALIIDVSKNAVSGNRELRELHQSKIPLLEKRTLDERLGRVAMQYFRALEEVPAQERLIKQSSGQTKFKF